MKILFWSCRIREWRGYGIRDLQNIITYQETPLGKIFILNKRKEYQIFYLKNYIIVFTILQPAALLFGSGTFWPDLNHCIKIYKQKWWHLKKNVIVKLTFQVFFFFNNLMYWNILRLENIHVRSESGPGSDLHPDPARICIRIADPARIWIR